VTLSPISGRLSKYDLPLYRRPDGKFVLHRIVRVEKDGYTCIGDNQFSYEYGVCQTWMIAVVTKFHRDGRAVSVKQWQYRLYCIVWHRTRFFRRIVRKIGRIPAFLKSRVGNRG